MTASVTARPSPARTIRLIWVLCALNLILLYLLPKPSIARFRSPNEPTPYKICTRCGNRNPMDAEMCQFDNPVTRKPCDGTDFIKENVQ